MKTRTYPFLLFLSLLIPILLPGCRDEDLLNRNGLGEGDVLMSVSYFPDVATSLGTRTSGNAIESLESLQVVVFDAEGNFIRIFNQHELEDLNLALTHNEHPSQSPEDSQNKGTWTQGGQGRATFRLSKLPRGAMHIYALANCSVSEAQVRDHAEDTTDEARFSTLSFDWNSANVGRNNQMCGYFTYDTNRTSDQPLAGLQAPTVTIDGTGLQLHCWLKRLASKVTVAFDGSGLHKNVNIYIHKVTIKDIPRSCTLASDNSPECTLETRSQALLENGESIYYSAVNQGESATNPGDGEEHHEDWMLVCNADSHLGSDHSATANSLFFFENCQGDYTSLPESERERYNKEPKAGWVHEYIDRPDSDYGKTPWDYDTKDKISAGTYVEVEGYYESYNDDNVTQGPIVYRFMLGKNTTYNYNAQRNHHYKLTLRFKGWANQPEWHIDYVEEKPDAFMPDEFFMPYVYNHRVEMPVRWVGDLQKIDFEIVENDWGPHPYSKMTAADPFVTPDEGPTTVGHDDTFAWNRKAWDIYNGLNSSYSVGGTGHTYLGFLALALEKDPPAAIINDLSYNSGETALKALKSHYSKNQSNGRKRQDKRTLTVSALSEGEHGSDASVDQSDRYTVVNEGISNTLHLPLFTRAMNMICISGYTGNNPYQAHYRFARLKATFTFNGQSDPIVLYTKVWQVPRLTNPKGIWFDTGVVKDFHVNLMERNGTNYSDNFHYLKSKGSWSAEIVAGSTSNFELNVQAGSGAVKNGSRIEGKTNSLVKFDVAFKGAAASAIIRVYYHAEKCIHEIFVRQGYGDVRLTPDGALWATRNILHGGSGTEATTTTSTGAEFVANPLSLGSYFKRKNLNEGILEKNNDVKGHLKEINTWSGGTKLELSNGSKAYWYNINRTIGGKASLNISLTGTAKYSSVVYDTEKWQKIKVGNTTYQVPTYNDYYDLYHNCDFAFGIFYTDDATEPQTDFKLATGYLAQFDGTTKKNGVRGMLAFNKATAEQLFFPLGKAGYARRRQAFLGNGSRLKLGYLSYGDVDYLLANVINGNSTNNVFRPIPYDMANAQGGIYWIRQIRAGGHVEGTEAYPCAGFDMNYQTVSCSPYTSNCLYYNGNEASWGGGGSYRGSGSDALPIKVVKTSTTKTFSPGE